MTLLRGKGLGLEVSLAGRDLDEALAELEGRLAERPDFYRGTAAVATFGASCPSHDHLTRLRALLSEFGIVLSGLGGGPEIASLARELDLGFEADEREGAELERRRRLRPRTEARLSEAARSLVADFAGARSDIADRRRRGEASVPRLEPRPAAAEFEPPAASLHVVEMPPGTLYHSGTLRGGQALHHVGNIVVAGDVNPGAELVASGDVLVFGQLAGVAHAGAQGDETSRVYAIRLTATQLRIATFIAADARSAPPQGPEVALIDDKRITIVPLDQLDRLQQGAS